MALQGGAWPGSMLIKAMLRTLVDGDGHDHCQVYGQNQGDGTRRPRVASRSLN